MPVGFAVDATGDLGKRLTADHRRDAGGEFDHLHPALDFGAGFRQRLAVFPGDQPRQFIEMRMDQFAIGEHDPCPLDHRRLAPCRQRIDGRGDRGIRVACRAGRHAADRFGRRRVVDRRRGRRVGGGPVSADQRPDQRWGSCVHGDQSSGSRFRQKPDIGMASTGDGPSSSGFWRIRLRPRTAWT